jgi:hypothetical protein
MGTVQFRALVYLKGGRSLAECASIKSRIEGKFLLPLRQNNVWLHTSINKGEITKGTWAKWNHHHRQNRLFLSHNLPYEILPGLPIPGN